MAKRKNNIDDIDIVDDFELEDIDDFDPFDVLDDSYEDKKSYGNDKPRGGNTSNKRNKKKKKNPVLVIPEIIVEYGFSYEEASTLGIDAFAAELKKKIDDTLKSFKLK